ncbi:hypothetical protein [Catenovulum sediminis]|uniref:hypothetical protein n=1 Tax=Catenovulum sediminis TaxID=1740262 RepID=UPI00117CF789|nr:hypothetical protein [Catenovulum sediminis]
MALDTSKFLGGDGSAGSPYIIHNADAFLALFELYAQDTTLNGKYFNFVSDIDLTYLSELSTVLSEPGQSGDEVGVHLKDAVLNGNGHKITFPTLVKVAGAVGSLFYAGTWNNFHFVFNGADSLLTAIFYQSSTSASDGSVLNYCRLSGVLNNINDSVIYHAANIHNCINDIVIDDEPGEYITNRGTLPGDSYYIEGANPYNSSQDGYIAQVDKLTAASYANLDPTEWDISDGLIPTPKLKPYTGLPVTRVAGITKIDGVPTKRRITVQDLNSGRVARMFSDALTGEFSIQTSPHKANLTVIVDDEMGNQIKENTAYALGDIVYPADYVGIVYVCTTAGTTHSELPSSYPTSGDFTSGTAAFSAKPINKPQVFSPVKPEIILE